MVAFRYSEWDGTQEIPALEADELLEALSDDLMNFGDLQHAMRNLLQRGMRDQNGNRLQGLRDLLQQLRQQRRNQLDKYNLSSLMDDIKKRLDEVLEMERGTIDKRMDDALGPQSGSPQTGPQDASDQPSPQSGAPAQQGEPSSSAPRSQQSPQSGEPGEQGGAQQPGQSGAGDNDQFAEMLKNIANRKKNFLSNLPPDVPGAVKELQNYEFMDPEAQHKFTELMDMLKKAMTETFFKDMYDQIANMSPEDMARMKQMVKDLNQMLSDRLAGGEPDFPKFMDKYGDLFGPNPPQTLDELVERMQAQAAQMQNLLDSLPGDMRQQLQELLQDKVGDPELQAELSELQANLEFLSPMRDMRNQYQFRGDDDIDLNEAMGLMDKMQSMDDLEKQLERTQYGGDIDDIDEEKLRELLGEEAADQLEQLKKLLEVLEESGYIRKKGNSYELTPRGTRKIGQKALGEIYSSLKDDSFGKHQIRDNGRGGERADDTKKYEFGDPFHLALDKTIMNSLQREGASVPVRLHKDDFEVYRSEQLTQTATVMMVDLSWSMALRGSFQAAKKVALALNNLIRSEFSRDSLYIIGFSAYARELQAEQLPYVRWDESVLGTNMHHALMLAQNLLAKHKSGTRQIIMISDGEPTAHLERGRSYFAYPPSPITIRETLKEVKRATQKGITINTFMLDRNYYLKEFVNQVAKINKGRVFYTTPDKLGQYILVDYVQNKRKNVKGQ
jgi:uncharacterized protein with von Willebrand factor type A (vWA) domain